MRLFHHLVFQDLSNVVPRFDITKLKIESFFDTNKYVEKPVAVQTLIEASLTLNEEEITSHELKIASFNLSEGLLEAAPQALLQTKHPDERWEILQSQINRNGNDNRDPFSH